MRRNSAIFGITLLVVFVLAVVGIVQAFGQVENTGEAPRPPLDRVIKDLGWKIPAVTRRRTSKPQSRIIDGVSVDFTLLIPRNRIINFVDYYVFFSDELRLLHERRRIDGMSALSVKGRIFAYVIDTSPYHGPDSSTSAVFIPVYFIDEDGDGKFEERVTAYNLVTLPKWVKL